MELPPVVLPDALTLTDPAAAAGAEIVIVLPFIPTETTPAPEILRAFETANDVEAAPNVLPRAVTDSDEVCTDAEIVIVLAA